MDGGPVAWQLHISSETLVYICDACDHETRGFALPELWAQGWRWHAAGDGRRWLVLCGSCERRFAERRAA